MLFTMQLQDKSEVIVESGFLQLDRQLFCEGAAFIEVKNVDTGKVEFFNKNYIISISEFSKEDKK